MIGSIQQVRRAVLQQTAGLALGAASKSARLREVADVTGVGLLGARPVDLERGKPHNICMISRHAMFIDSNLEFRVLHRTLADLQLKFQF